MLNQQIRDVVHPNFKHSVSDGHTVTCTFHFHGSVCADDVLSCQEACRLAWPSYVVSQALTSYAPGEGVSRIAVEVRMVPTAKDDFKVNIDGHRMYLMDRLQADRMLFAEVISSIMTEPQLDARPKCLKGISIREAWVSWSAGFSPSDKVKKDAS